MVTPRQSYFFEEDEQDTPIIGTEEEEENLPQSHVNAVMTTIATMTKEEDEVPQSPADAAVTEPSTEDNTEGDKVGDTEESVAKKWFDGAAYNSIILAASLAKAMHEPFDVNPDSSELSQFATRLVRARALDSGS